MNDLTPFENFLNQHDENAWTAAVTDLLSFVHEVDRNATQIWFKFYPLALARVLDESPDAELLAKQLLMQGDYQLEDQIDSSHKFFYGHRYWPEVKKAVAAHAAGFQPTKNADLEADIRRVAATVAAQLKVDESLLVGITAAAFMTVQQVGLKAFDAAPGKVSVAKRQAREKPEDVLNERAKDDNQGLFGFLKTVDKEWTVTYDETEERARFKLINEEELASAAARDQSRDWREADARCVEGPIPVECRAASCGTCWVGVLGGAEKLSDVSRLEGKKIKEFGYIETSERKPLIRLACMARATGAVSIVIPPWNGFFGKYFKELERAKNAPAAEQAETETAQSNGAGN